MTVASIGMIPRKELRGQTVGFKEPDRPGHEAIEVETDDGRVNLITFRHFDPEQTDRLLPPA